jgi:hypothetical protein
MFYVSICFFVSEVKIRKNERVANLLIAGNEIERYRIDAMTGIFTGVSLTQENMTKVAVTVGTNDLGPAPVCIRYPFNSSLDLIVEAWPPALTVKFIGGTVERSVASAAHVNPCFLVIHEFPCPGPFGTLFHDDKILERCQLIIFCRIHDGLVIGAILGAAGLTLA